MTLGRLTATALLIYIVLVCGPEREAFSAPPREHGVGSPIIETSGCSTWSGKRLYVLGYGGPNNVSVFVYKANARGNAKPLCRFESSVLLGSVAFGGTAVDSSGKVWLTDESGATIWAFAPGASGSVNPSQTISGEKTLLPAEPVAGAQQPATDAGGNLWVPVTLGGESGAYLLQFASNANGDVAPSNTIGYGDEGKSEGLTGPTGLAFDPAGNLWVAESNQIIAFSPPFSDTSKPVVSFSVDAGQIYAINIGVDAKNNVYAGSQDGCFVLVGGLGSSGKPSKVVEASRPMFGLAAGAKNAFVGDQGPTGQAVAVFARVLRGGAPVYLLNLPSSADEAAEWPAAQP